MKSLIIVGNGFDIALGLETRFQDFILDYLKNSVIKCFRNLLDRSRILHKGESSFYHYYKDDLIEIKITKQYRNYEEACSVFNDVNSLLELQKLARLNGVHIEHKFDLLTESIKELISFNWVDVEMLYFKFLLKKKDIDNQIKSYNSKFRFLTEKLIEYLNRIQLNDSCLENEHILTLLSRFSDIISRSSGHLKQEIRSKLVLNFNYTNTFDYLRQVAPLNMTNIINIHGKLNDDSNPIIFGFGDEHDEDYNEMKKSKSKELFRHIKSINYFKTRNYPNLKKFMEESDEFEVVILGHSCSVSDRTLLKEIFENPKCKFIRIFYHEWESEKEGFDEKIMNNDFEDKTIEILRHFSKEVNMRGKIVTKDFCEPMPQLKLN
jgi:Bacteriophage abortive infection AbiH